MSEQHKDLRNQMRAYAALQLAVVLFIVRNPVDIHGWSANLILIFFCISIPSSLAYSGLARLTPEDEQRNPNPISAVSQLLAFVPSVAAFALIISGASGLAAIVFLVSVIGWVTAVVRLRKFQQSKP